MINGTRRIRDAQPQDAPMLCDAETAEPDGVFCYTFFKARARSP